MFVPSRTIQREIEVKRSRFIAEVRAISDRADAEREIRRTRERFADATHVVFAFAFGDDKSIQYGMSDDGEPKGTAGRPVLELVKGREITDCLLTVVRYFGGTKLGTGGLVRAYGDAARSVLDALPLQQKRSLKDGTVVVGYELHRPVRTVLDNAEVEIVHEDFGERITISVRYEEARRASIERSLENVSRGTISLEKPT